MDNAGLWALATMIGCLATMLYVIYEQLRRIADVAEKLLADEEPES
jgi:hypothetical protein